MAKPTLRIGPVWACPMGRPAYSEVVSKRVQHTVSIVEGEARRALRPSLSGRTLHMRLARQAQDRSADSSSRGSGGPKASHFPPSAEGR